MKPFDPPTWGLILLALAIFLSFTLLAGRRLDEAPSSSSDSSPGSASLFVASVTLAVAHARTVRPGVGARARAGTGAFVIGIFILSKVSFPEKGLKDQQN